MNAKTSINNAYQEALKIFNKGDYLLALKNYKAIVKSKPDSVEVLNDIGLCYKQLKKYQLARHYLKLASGYEPKSWIPYSNIANTYIEEENINKAHIYLQKAAKLNCDSSTYYDLAYSYEELGNYEMAIKYYLKVIKLDPNDSDSHFNLANCYSKLKNYSKSINHYKKASKLSRSNPDILINLGIDLSFIDKHKEAIECFDKAIKIKPKDPATMFSKALSYQSLEQYDKALVWINKAIKINPKYPDYYDGCGDIYYDWDKYKEAIESYQKAIELGSTRKETKKWLAKLLREQNKKK